MFNPKKKIIQMEYSVREHICNDLNLNALLCCAGGVLTCRVFAKYNKVQIATSTSNAISAFHFLQTDRYTVKNHSFNCCWMPNYKAIFEQSKSDPRIVQHALHPSSIAANNSRHQMREIMCFHSLYDICMLCDTTLLPNQF